MSSRTFKRKDYITKVKSVVSLRSEDFTQSDERKQDFVLHVLTIKKIY